MTNWKHRWSVALAHAGLTEAKWARSRGLTPGHVRQVVIGDRVSSLLRPQILAFIEEREELLWKELADRRGRPARVA